MSALHARLQESKHPIKLDSETWQSNSREKNQIQPFFLHYFEFRQTAHLLAIEAVLLELVFKMLSNVLAIHFIFSRVLS